MTFIQPVEGLTLAYGLILTEYDASDDLLYFGYYKSPDAATSDDGCIIVKYKWNAVGDFEKSQKFIGAWDDRAGFSWNF